MTAAVAGKFEVVMDWGSTVQRALFNSRKDAEDCARRVVTKLAHACAASLARNAVPGAGELRLVTDLVWSTEQGEVDRGFRMWNAMAGVVDGVKPVRIVASVGK